MIHALYCQKISRNRPRCLTTALTCNAARPAAIPAAAVVNIRRAAVEVRRRWLQAIAYSWAFWRHDTRLLHRAIEVEQQETVTQRVLHGSYYY